jgi:hypothetical protein
MLHIRGQSVADRLNDDGKNSGNSRGGLPNGTYRDRTDDGDEVNTETDQFG